MASTFCKTIKKPVVNIPLRIARRLVSPTRLIFLVALIATIMAFAGSAARNNAYPGPKPDYREVGIVVPGIESEFRTNYVAILRIDAQEEMEQWSGDAAEFVYLLPGGYRFGVEHKQTTQGTTIPIVDLISAVQDMATAAKHSKTGIEFPVKTGFTHRFHYDESKEGFSVSLGSATQSEESLTLHASDNAVPCIQDPDQSQDFWCALPPETVER